MEIPAIIYFLVGILVTAISLFLPGFTIFIIVGIILMAVGIGKYVIRKEKPSAPTHPSGRYIQCKKCGAWNHPHVEFCHFCKRHLH